MPKVRDDFKKLFRPLDADERLRLRTSLETDGCRDPIVVWAEEDTILDGHNRSLICDSLGIPYTETRISLPDETAARKWIIHNQLARRNLTPNELSFLRGLRYEAEKQPHGGPRQDANFASCSASDSLAAEFGVSERTIHRDAEFARQVQAASEKFGEQAKIDILKGAVAKDFTCAAIVQSGTCPQLGDYSGRFRLTMELCAPSAIPFRANCRSVARMQCARAGR